MSDPTHERLVRAAREEVTAYGVRRATATSIAARAGVSRMTVYRRLGGVQQLVLDALYGDFADATTTAIAKADGDTVRQQLASGIRTGITRLNDSPLVIALRQHDPELLLPYLVDHLGRAQELLRASFAEYIAAGQAEGSIRQGDPDTLALVLLLAVQAPVISWRVLLTATDGAPEATLAEIDHLVTTYLEPQ